MVGSCELINEILVQDILLCLEYNIKTENVYCVCQTDGVHILLSYN
jgi:hypothetical protein